MVELTPSARKLQQLLDRPGILIMPGCFDALSARLVEKAGFELGFMSGYCVSAARLGVPDTQLISYHEMFEQGRDLCQAVRIPVIGDGDTGYGNALNVKRTVHGYAQAGFACIMIEDQVAPKRCGHTRGKAVVGREEALLRIRAAVDAKREGAGILIMARTDARATHGIEEAIWRAQAFADLGADILFIEAPTDEDEMRRFCAAVQKPTMANMIEAGRTPILPPARLQELGYKIAVYPLTLLNAAIQAMQTALNSIRAGETASNISDFATLCDVVGFNDYYRAEERYSK